SIIQTNRGIFIGRIIAYVCTNFGVVTRVDGKGHKVLRSHGQPGTSEDILPTEPSFGYVVGYLHVFQSQVRTFLYELIGKSESVSVGIIWRNSRNMGA